MTLRETRTESPVGRLRLVAGDDAIVGLYLPDHARAAALETGDGRGFPVLEEARAQLAQWFAGLRREFDLPLRPAGTPFQREVWNALRAIPFGETRTYGDVARTVGRPEAVRAVGAANARNPISIVVPCHRVVGADGSLTGYAGGIDRKRWLLAHEGAAAGVTARSGRNRR